MELSQIVKDIMQHFDNARGRVATLARYAEPFDAMALLAALRGEEVARVRREAGSDEALVFHTWARHVVHEPLRAIEEYQAARVRLREVAGDTRDRLAQAQAGLRAIDDKLRALPPSSVIAPEPSLGFLHSRTRELRAMIDQAKYDLDILVIRETDEAQAEEVIAQARRGLARYAGLALAVHAEELVRRARPTVERLTGLVRELSSALAGQETLVRRAEVVSGETIDAGEIRFPAREALRDLVAPVMEFVPPILSRETTEAAR